MILLSYLFRAAADLSRTIQQEVLDAYDVTALVVDAVYKNNTLSMFSGVYLQLRLLFSTACRKRELPLVLIQVPRLTTSLKLAR